jgi:hypothetical protein
MTFLRMVILLYLVAGARCFAPEPAYRPGRREPTPASGTRVVRLDRLISAGVAVLRALARALTRIDNFLPAPKR